MIELAALPELRTCESVPDCQDEEMAPAHLRNQENFKVIADAADTTPCSCPSIRLTAAVPCDRNFVSMLSICGGYRSMPIDPEDR